MDRHEHRGDDDDGGGALAAFLQTCATVGATLFGLLLMLVGAYYVVRLLEAIFSAATQPAVLGGMIDGLEQAIGADSIQIEVPQATVRGARLLAVFGLWVVVFTLGWLSLALIRTGASVVQITTKNRAAIRGLLGDALRKKEDPAGGATRGGSRGDGRPRR